jgi:hypothetical protein
MLGYLKLEENRCDVRQQNVEDEFFLGIRSYSPLNLALAALARPQPRLRSNFGSPPESGAVPAS